MDPDPYRYCILLILNINLPAIDIAILGVIVLIILIFLSAMISGSEVAYFSLSPKQKRKLLLANTSLSRMIIKQLGNPEKLLATILVTNNFINVAIIIISAYLTNPLFAFINNEVAILLIQLVVITFFLFLFGELLPKVFASKYQLTMTRLMTVPINIAGKVFYPICYLLMSSTKIVNRRLKKHSAENFDMNELSDAIKLASDQLQDEKEMLEGIVNFSNIEVKEIMTPRMDIFAIEKNTKFTKVVGQIVESAFSRIPIYQEDMDNILGLLFIKDVLPHLNNSNKKEFEWQKLIRPHYIVPETKKINELLNEFKKKKVHMAIVVDEYGGVNGLITMEDILEEIVGEIEDETDVVDEYYKVIGKDEFEFNAKISLIDFCKAIDIEYNVFEDIKGDADTLAGLILEIRGDIPEKNELINYDKFSFTITAVDKRRIKKVKVKIRK